jgi:hypothetical protein
VFRTVMAASGPASSHDLSNVATSQVMTMTVPSMTADEEGALPVSP